MSRKMLFCPMTPIMFTAAGFLPSFWMTELALNGSPLNTLLALLTAALFTALFAQRFYQRVL